MSNYHEALQQMISVADMLAPNKKSQAAIAAMIADMKADECNPSDILTQLLLVTADGMRYNNWPQK